MFSLFADAGGADLLSRFWPGTLSALVYGLVGIVLLLIGYWLFDLLNHSQIDVQKELREKNVAVAIVVAASAAGHCLHLCPRRGRLTRAKFRKPQRQTPP